MIKTPDVVNLDKSHVSFCGKAFRFRQEIKRSLHETKSEISWNREAWVHETKSEFVEGRGERCTKSSRNSSGKGESGCTKPSRNSSKAVESAARNHVGTRRFAGGVLPVTASAFAIGQQGRGGGATFLAAAKRRCRKRKKYPTQVGYFYMKTDFDVVCFQKVSRPKPF